MVAALALGALLLFWLHSVLLNTLSNMRDQALATRVSSLPDLPRVARVPLATPATSIAAPASTIAALADTPPLVHIAIVAMNTEKRYSDATATMRSVLMHRTVPVRFHLVTDFPAGPQYFRSFFAGTGAGHLHCWDMRFYDGASAIATHVQPFLSRFGLHINHYAGTSAMVKLFMPYVLPHIDHFIVLDADVVVVQDIATLWSMLQQMPIQPSLAVTVQPFDMASKVIRPTVASRVGQFSGGPVRPIPTDRLIASEQLFNAYSSTDPKRKNFREFWSGLEVKPPAPPLVGIWRSPFDEGDANSPRTNAHGGPFYIGGVYLCVIYSSSLMLCISPHASTGTLEGHISPQAQHSCVSHCISTLSRPSASSLCQHVLRLQFTCGRITHVGSAGIVGLDRAFLAKISAIVSTQWGRSNILEHASGMYQYTHTLTHTHTCACSISRLSCSDLKNSSLRCTHPFCRVCDDRAGAPSMAGLGAALCLEPTPQHVFSCPAILNLNLNHQLFRGQPYPHGHTCDYDRQIGLCLCRPPTCSVSLWSRVEQEGRRFCVRPMVRLQHPPRRTGGVLSGRSLCHQHCKCTRACTTVVAQGFRLV